MLPDMRSILARVVDAAQERVWDALWVKTFDQYGRMLRKGARDLYNGKIGENELLDKMVEAVDGQMRRAWYAGMRENGLDAPGDMTDEWEGILQGIIDSEMEHILDFIDFVKAEAAAGNGLENIYARVELWQGRFTDVENQAIMITAKKDDLLEWVYGDTQHCDTCAALNGTVLTAAEWAESGYHPQQPENEMLDCGGWRCACVLEPTDKKRTGLPDGL